MTAPPAPSPAPYRLVALPLGFQVRTAGGDRASPVFRDRCRAEAVLAALLARCGRRKRLCLGCLKMFMSAEPGERLCMVCRHRPGADTAGYRVFLPPRSIAR